MAHNALGAALLKLARIDEAELMLRRALELQPELAAAHSNLGYLLFRERERSAEGTRHIETALTIAPGDEGVLCNWCMVLQQQGRFDEMLALADRLLSGNPTLHEVRLNRALVLLTRGEFERGWKDYEARRLLPPFSQGAQPWPEWTGGSLASRRILVYAEQGLGDEIMFASCLPDVLHAAQACVVECAPRLQGLFQRSFPAARVVAARGRGVAAGDHAPDHRIDCCTPVGSLPRFYRNAPSDFPRHQGYLVADRARVMHWTERLSGLGSGLKVGISWRGGVQTTRRSLRSVPLDQWLPILQCRDVQFVSLQYSNVQDELAKLSAQHGVVVRHWQAAIDDLDEAAALITALDLVITVQTTVAHLAGALGKEAWVMIPVVPEWRYLVRGESMPWYPALRLYRQQSLGDWGPLVKSIAARLEAHIVDPRACDAARGSS
jgi:tetratricopeptide (TPR) repeat protein